MYQIWDCFIVFLRYLPLKFSLHSKTNTIFWAVIACLLWSTAYPGIKFGLQYDEPFHFSGIRFIISGLLILPFAVKQSAYLKMVKEHWKLIFVVAFLQTFINYSLFYHGLDLAPGAIGAVVVGSQPLITAIVASFFHSDERFTSRKIITIVCGLLGVILISAGRQAFNFGDAAELLGVGMLLFANTALSVSNVIISFKSKGLNPMVLSSSSLFLGGVMLFLVSLPVEGVPNNFRPMEYWLVLIWLSIMAAVAFSIWFILLQRPGVKVSELNLLKFIVPVVGAILSWTLLPDENPEWITVSGILIIITSLILFHLDSGKPVDIKTDSKL